MTAFMIDSLRHPFLTNVGTCWTSQRGSSVLGCHSYKLLVLLKIDSFYQLKQPIIIIIIIHFLGVNKPSESPSDPDSILCLFLVLEFLKVAFLLGRLLLC